MSELEKKHCKPCEERTGKLEAGTAQNFLEELNKWNIVEEKYIEKTLLFKDFASALAFINKIGEIAERENHHPDLCLFSWNKIKITLSTHSVGGLTENDFILAGKIDELAK